MVECIFVLTLIRYQFYLCVTTVAYKDWPFCQKCEGQITAKHTYAFKPTKIREGWLCCPGIVWEPIGNMSSYTTSKETLVQSYLSCELWTDPWPIRVKMLPMSWFMLKKCWQGMIHWTFPHNPAMQGKATSTRMLLSGRTLVVASPYMPVDPKHNAVLYRHCQWLVCCQQVRGQQPAPVATTRSPSSGHPSDPPESSDERTLHAAPWPELIAACTTADWTKALLIMDRCHKNRWRCC